MDGFALLALLRPSQMCEHGQYRAAVADRKWMLMEVNTYSSSLLMVSKRWASRQQGKGSIRGVERVQYALHGQIEMSPSEARGVCGVCRENMKDVLKVCDEVYVREEPGKNESIPLVRGRRMRDTRYL